MVVQRPQTARHRVARGVVAADQQQQDVAHELLRPRRQVARRLAVHQHGDQVGSRRLRGALVPERDEILHHLLQHRVAFFVGVDLGAGARVHRRDVRPVGELPPLLERKVEQRGKHLRGQFNRHAIDPVERLAARQFIQHPLRPLTNRAGEPLQIHRRHHRRHDLALFVVLRLVHRDEARSAIVHRRVAQRDAAHQRVGRVDLLAGVDLHDVLVPGHRPVRAVHAVLAPVYRVVAAQALEIRIPDVILVQPRLAHVDLVERNRIGVFARVDTDGSVHRVSSLLLAGTLHYGATCCPLRQALRRRWGADRSWKRPVRTACPCPTDRRR